MNHLTTMFDPTNWQTWTRLDDHPIFGAERARISSWSHDPSQYCQLDNYTRFDAKYYVHFDPPPPVEFQRTVAARDVQTLADTCRQITERYGATKHELVILDDFTVFVWLRNNHSAITIYPLQLDNEFKLMLFAESPLVIDELRCINANELVETIAQLISR